MADDIDEKPRDGTVRYCSFCQKRQDDVEKLIAGPGPSLFVCNECVDLLWDICHPRDDGDEQKISADETALRDVYLRLVELETDVKSMLVRIEERAQAPQAGRRQVIEQLVKERRTRPPDP